MKRVTYAIIITIIVNLLVSYMKVRWLSVLFFILGLFFVLSEIIAVIVHHTRPSFRPDNLKDFRKITIRKRFFRPLWTLPKPRLFLRNRSFSITRTFIFDNQFLYDEKENPGYHKLFGISLFHPHYISDRWAVKKQNGCLLFAPYAYDDFERLIGNPYSIDHEGKVMITLSLDYSNNKMMYKIGDDVVHVEKGKYPRIALMWLNNPYFEVKEKISYYQKT